MRRLACLLGLHDYDYRADCGDVLRFCLHCDTPVVVMTPRLPVIKPTTGFDRLIDWRLWPVTDGPVRHAKKGRR